MASDNHSDKPDFEHLEVVKSSTADNGSDSEHDEKPPPAVETRMTKAKWLACISLCISYSTAFQQNAVTAAIAKHIDDELGEEPLPLMSLSDPVYQELTPVAGPTTYYNWILSAYTIAVSVTFPLSGGLSDIFGRRYFFLGGTVISLVGTVIAAAGQTTSTIICGMVFKGIGGGSQQLA